MDSRPTVEVCFTPNLYPLHFDGSDIIVVIDVLRATSAICAGLSNGVEKIIPVASIEEAIEYRQKGYIVAAERKGKVVEGFNLGNSPSSWLNKELVGKTVVLTTTNGTQAIHTARRCKHMVIGSLINLDALVTYLHEKKKNVMLLGSGWRNKFCLEDTICAGAIAEGLLPEISDLKKIQQSLLSICTYALQLLGVFEGIFPQKKITRFESERRH